MDSVKAVLCGFFDAVNHDRTYTADDMNRPYSRVVADGVFATNSGTPSDDLQVYSTGGMSVSVKKGQAIVGSKWFENPFPVGFTVESNTNIYSRIDSIIMQMNKTSRGGNLVYRTGEAASSPTAPALVNNGTIFEYRLANITVAPMASIITDSVITDTRGSSDCPWVTGLIQQVDTSTLWAQFQSAYATQFDAFTADYNSYIAAQRAAWHDFLASLTQDLDVSMTVLTFDSTYIAEGAVTEIPIGIPTYNIETDVLQVFINGLFAAGKYTVTDSTKITLNTAIAAGDEVYFVVFKSLAVGDIESAVGMIRRVDEEVMAFSADSGWIPLDPVDGTVTKSIQIRCIGTKVFLRGAVKGITTTTATICSIPANMRPSAVHNFVSLTHSGVTGSRTILLQITTGGAVKLVARTGAITATDEFPIDTSFIAGTGTLQSIVYDYKGSVSTYAELPEDPNIGDVYMVLTSNTAHHILAGDSVMWNGVEWEVLVGAMTASDIASVLNNIFG